MMVARKISEQYPHIKTQRGQLVMEVEGFDDGRRYHDASFKAYANEIVTFYGLVGAGRTELMRGILGADKYIAGRMTIDGKRGKKIKSPTDAKNQGIVYI